ncbi:MAG: hypothetical protein E5W83_30355 [Mesorhizobium sp.]|nr:MAG: hypothetical protein E5W83_30355 [Mesorhizobium sp.]
MRDFPRTALPTRGEIGRHLRFRQSPTLQEERRPSELPISPLVGEMFGRTERGAVPPASQRFCTAAV